MSASFRKSCSNLIHAARRGDDRAVARWIDHGANVNCRDEHGATPIMLASEANKPDCVLILMNAGADLYLSDMDGFSVTDYAKGIAKAHRERIPENVVIARMNLSEFSLDEDQETDPDAHEDFGDTATKPRKPRI